MSVSLRDFGWDRAVVATLRHSSLPWHDATFAPEIILPASPLTSITTGLRDRLSLLAQFAAHIAFLQFAGIPDGDVKASDWVVIQKRGSDCRLLRIAARSCPAEATPPALTVAQQFAEIVGAPDLDVLKQSWARPEAVYLDAIKRLQGDAAADLRWVCAASSGEMAAPGDEALRSIWTARGGKFAGTDSFPAVEAMASLDDSVRVLRLGGASLPSRFSAIEPLRALAGSFESLTESEIAERVAVKLADEHCIFLVAPHAEFDPPSWNVVDLLSRFSGATWIFAEDHDPLPPSRIFTIASPITRASGALITLAEPRRSYVGALALLGTTIPGELATQFLSRFFFDQPLQELVVDGMTWFRDGLFGFASDEHREGAVQTIPAASRAALCRVAAEVAEPARAAGLLIEAGDFEQAANLLQQLTDAQLIAALQAAPPALLATRTVLAARFAGALVNAGRYRDAAVIAALLPEPEKELMLARCERRMGDYVPALSRLERLTGFEADLLRAEILRITNRAPEAMAVLEQCHPGTTDQKVRHGYARSLSALENGALADESWIGIECETTPYLAARFATYRHPSIETADRSLQQARSAVERADALVDRVFVLFSAGRWEEARREAVAGLAAIDETQGDRAAGAFLFFLAFLAADDAQWLHAAQWTARLRHFYGTTGDELRLAELDLLSAHLDFSRGRFDSAVRSAMKVIERPLHPQIVEAAALIIDEIGWIRQQSAPLRSRGASGNAELDDRHRLLRKRNGKPVDPVGVFHRALAKWENDNASPPAPSTRSETLKLFRSALARRLPLATQLARELDIEISGRQTDEAGIRILRAVARASFPFSREDFAGVSWRLASRNRLGHWSEIPFEEPTPAADLDRISTNRTIDWIALSDRELLFIEGSSGWPAESREAVAEIVRIKSENHRLRRIVEQEERAHPLADPNAIEGLVGQSAPIRELQGRIMLLARRDVAACITGESGTGKELVARAIHRHSSRRGRTFTAVNCAALPENLIESELFGHVRGAFTGADRDRPGLIETTDGGTLFLDEIGEMPQGAQAKMLRFLQEGEFRRVGETTNRNADVRVVSATNRKLESAVAEGRFREDLYYRVCGVAIELPPLRDRGADVSLLASHFLAAERARHRSGPVSFSADVEAVFRTYRWPGNVRELQNTIRAAHAMAGDGRQIDLEHLPERLRGVPRLRVKASSYQDEVTRFRRELIERSLDQVRGNQNQAALLLNMSRQALAYQIRELGILVGKSPRRTAV